MAYLILNNVDIIRLQKNKANFYNYEIMQKKIIIFGKNKCPMPNNAVSSLFLHNSIKTTHHVSNIPHLITFISRELDWVCDIIR